MGPAGKAVRILVVTAIGGAVWVGGSAPEAQACTCLFAPGDMGRVSEPVDAVFAGVPVHRDRGPSRITFDVQVNAVLHGEVADNVVVSTEAAATACGSDLIVGAEYLMFTKRRSSAPSEFVVDKCSATTPITDGETLRAAGRIYGDPVGQIGGDRPPISAGVWLGAAGAISVLGAAVGVFLVGRRKSR
jgi:hypothetical protein